MKTMVTSRSVDRQSGEQRRRVHADASLESQIQKLRDRESLPSDTLTDERKKEIVELACAVYPSVAALRQRHLESRQRDFARTLAESREAVMNHAAWSSMLSVDSATGHRFVIGFRNVGCAYWRQDPFHLGCFNCGYCSGVAAQLQPTLHELETQFENALRQAIETNVDFDVVEFLNDGSFFNDEEFAPAFRQRLFHRLNSLPYVTRVLVETRPEYVTRECISQVLSELAPGKKLEVAIGLESADEFIRGVCIRKGFDRADFEEAIRCLSPFGDRVQVVAYSLVKPAFLSEMEAVEDAVHTAQYLAGLSAQSKCRIVLKLEPAVVAEGTLLDLLYFHGQDAVGHPYSVMSYWSVLEILCRLRQKDIRLPVRIGAREDMDIVQKVPALYNADGMFNKWDFVLYEAVQHFNIHRALPRLLAEVDEMFSDTSFDIWKKHLGLTSSAIDDCRARLAPEIVQAKQGSDERSRSVFLGKIFAALNRIEYSEKGRRYARTLARRTRRHGTEEMRASVERFVRGEFRRIAKDFWVRVQDVYFEVDEPQLMRVSLQVRDLSVKGSLYSVWTGIPTGRVKGVRPRGGPIRQR
ncbi:MAG: hypothetical protein A2Y77_10015 [Planctomycetes bacterium RBG_13_62_9]|nr:MAG: hypothetical protein A2Y77_10015 [Planctomycetes bacterium RBG_13_62_9]